jgi:hypothetical protein
VFDDGRLKSASYNTTEGFGLRGRRRDRGLCPFQRDQRGGPAPGCVKLLVSLAPLGYEPNGAMILTEPIHRVFAGGTPATSLNLF